MAHEPAASASAEALSSSGDPVGAVSPVALDRLLSVAVLTPAQAVLVAVRLLDAADMAGLAAGAEPSGTRLGAVTLTPSGDLDVTAPHADEGPTVTELLERLLQNARRLPAHPRPEQVLLLRRLEEVGAAPLGEPNRPARELEASLTDTLGPEARGRISGQLAALVQAFAHVAPGVPGAPTPSISLRPAAGPVTQTAANGAVTQPASPLPGSPAPVPHLAGTAVRHAPSRPPRRKGASLYRRRRIRRVGLVAFVLAAALAVSSYVALGPGAAFVESLGPDSEPPAPAPTAPAEPPEQSAKQPQSGRPQALPALAGRHAGPITGVVLQKIGECRPGGVCQVKVTVRFRPASSTQSVGWKVGAARLCERGIAWSPRTTVTAQPGWTTVYAHSSVRVPKDRSLALLALTTTPARAQSRPVPVTGSSLRC